LKSVTHFEVTKITDRLSIVRKNPDSILKRDPDQAGWFKIKQFKRPETLAGEQVNKLQDGRAPLELLNTRREFQRTVRSMGSFCTQGVTTYSYSLVMYPYLYLYLYS